MKAEGPTAPSQPAVIAEAASVLLVDDRPANLLALEAILGGLPLRTVRANSGAEALRELRKRDFALVLLDVQMPDMDGFQTASAIKADPRIAEIPIIFITAIDRDAAHVFQGYERGAVDYILKPFDADILKAKVSIFVDLYTKGETIKAQAQLLRQQEIEALERRTEERYRRLADLMPLMMWATRPDGSVYYTNRAWVDYSGLSLSETETLADPQVLHPDDVGGVAARWKEARDAKTPFEMQYRMRRRLDGQYRWHLARGVPERDELGEIEGWVVTATDIDDQKHLEQAREEVLERERVARETAESANRTKDEFLANVSHELRTPLSSILGWARMLRSGSVEPARVNRALETIERNANNQTELIEDLLDVSRIISGKLRLQREKIDLAGLVQAAVETVHPSADAKGVGLAFVTGSGIEEIWADSARLQQVVTNLLSNAVKFTPKGGRVEVSIAQRESIVAVAVKDTGAGIGRELLPHVFDRFRQADNASSRTHKGLGLGLAIARHIAELHGGRIEAESAGLGQGSTFTLTIPVGVPLASDSEPDFVGEASERDAARTLPRLDGLRMIIASNQAEARDRLTSLFEGCGATVVACNSADEAVTELERATTHALISDIELDDFDGYALIRRVRALAPSANPSLPAIAVGGFVTTEARRRALAAGYQVFLAKPVHPAELVDLVRSLAQPTPASG